jgi:adenylate cyclase
MSDTPPFSPLFDGLAQWTLQQGLHETTVSDLVQGFGRRLVAGGVPVSRISVGSLILHPVFGAIDVIWEADHDEVSVSQFPRIGLTTPEFQNAPFFQIISGNLPVVRQRFEQPE